MTARWVRFHPIRSGLDPLEMPQDRNSSFRWHHVLRFQPVQFSFLEIACQSVLKRRQCEAAFARKSPDGDGRIIHHRSEREPRSFGNLFGKFILEGCPGIRRVPDATLIVDKEVEDGMGKVRHVSRRHNRP